MSLPFFYADGKLKEGSVIEPPEDTARHIVQVLRMREGEALIITDGRGDSARCEISTVSKKNCTLKVGAVISKPPFKHHITVAISLLKNAGRFEWFLEKAAENGINQIIPLLCERTEKQRFRKDRADSILISALQQSQQSWLTEINEPIDLKLFLHRQQDGRKYIAHCLEHDKNPLSRTINEDDSRSIILIGPEGDFSPDEIDMALVQGYKPVSLGETRLRTETAGLAAAILLKQLGSS